MAKFILFIIYFLAQYGNLFSQDCDCADNLKFLITKVEDNYAGFFDRTRGSEGAYKAFKDSLTNSVNQQSILDYSCYLKFRKYIKYFRDPHLNLSFDVTNEKEKVSLFFKSLNGLSILQRTEEKKVLPDLMRLRGIWSDNTGLFEIKIIPVAPDSLIGYIHKGDGIYWHEKQLKIEIKRRSGDYYIKYYVKDHRIIIDSMAKIKDEIKVFSQLPLYKKTKKADISFEFRVLKNKVGYFKLPDFLPESKAKVDSVLEIYSKVYRDIRYLILDVRNNTGGSSICYYPFLQYFYTDSVPFFGGTTRSTIDNINMYRKSATDTAYPKYVRKAFLALADTLGMYPNQFVRTDKTSSFKLNVDYELPEKVVFLMNDRCLSATEYFLHCAKYSRKAVLVGKESYGGLNYVTVNSDIHLPCRFIYINYPIFRSDRVDEKGAGSSIRPDIELKIPEKDWVQFALNYLLK